MKQSHKTILLWGVLILMFYLIYSIVSAVRSDRDEVAFSEFLQLVDEGKLNKQSVTILDGKEFWWGEGSKEKVAFGVVTNGRSQVAFCRSLTGALLVP